MLWEALEVFTLQGRGGAGTAAVTSAQASGEAALGAATTT